MQKQKWLETVSFQFGIEKRRAPVRKGEAVYVKFAIAASVE